MGLFDSVSWEGVVDMTGNAVVVWESFSVFWRFIVS